MERRAFFPSAVRERVAPLARRGRADIVLALVLTVVAGLVGGVHVAGSEDGFYYQAEYAPAVMRACGHGFAGYDGTADAVTEFLAVESRSLDCDDVDSLGARDANVFATGHRYLLESAALLWRLDNVSWDALLPLFVLLYAISGIALFGVFRLVVGRVAAALGTLVLVFSPLQLDMLLDLRDYAKTPFLLAGFFFAGLFATRRFGLGSAGLLGGLAGLVLGVGFGFRADVLVALPMIVVAVVAFWPDRWRLSPAPRAAALAATVGVFLLTALPVIIAFSSGGNLFLMGVHGQTEPFTEFLDLKQDLYDAGALYLDPYAVALTNAHDLLVDGNVRELRMGTTELDEASSSRYASVVSNLPADFLVRADASVLHVLDSAPEALAEPVPASVDALGIPGALRDVLATLLGPLDNGWIVVLVALVVGATRSPRLAVGALLAVLYLGSLISFQAAVRHSFYLEFIWWVAVAYLAHEAWALGMRVWRLREERTCLARSFSYRRPAIGVAIFGAALLATVVVPLAAARAYQGGHMADVLSELERAKRTPVVTKDVEVDGRTSLVSMPEDSPAWRGIGTRVALLAARFNGRRCPYPQLRPIARYEAATDYDDFSTPLDIRYPREGDARVTAYFLVFFTPRTRFAGLELPAGARPCLEALEVVTDTSRLPVLVDARLGADWREATRYQAFAWEDTRAAAAGKPYVVADPLATYSYAELASGSEFRDGSASFRADGVEPMGVSGWRFAGEPDAPFTYLTVSAPIDLEAGRHVIVRGRIGRGGLRVGLQRQGEWSVDEAVVERGEFWAVVRAPATGTYQVVVANELSEHEDGQDVVVEEIRVA